MTRTYVRGLMENKRTDVRTRAPGGGRQDEAVRRMAIAPLMDYEGLPDGTCGPVERPWPRAVGVVAAVGQRRDRTTADRQEHRTAEPGARGTMPPRAGHPSRSLEGARHSAAARRRRRLLLAALVAGLVVVLALPFGALGGSTATPRGPGVEGSAATVYVVQPGDTLWSIASHFDRSGDPRPLAEAIAKDTGSAAVVPGERIAIP